MRRTYQAFNLFATGIVSPRVALFRKHKVDAPHTLAGPSSLPISTG